MDFGNPETTHWQLLVRKYCSRRFLFWHLIEMSLWAVTSPLWISVFSSGGNNTCFANNRFTLGIKEIMTLKKFWKYKGLPVCLSLLKIIIGFLLLILITYIFDYLLWPMHGPSLWYSDLRFDPEVHNFSSMSQYFF